MLLKNDVKLDRTGKYLYSSFILLTQCHESPATKLTNFPIFYHSSPFVCDINFKEPLPDCASQNKI